MQEEELLWKGLQVNIRGDVRKAKNKLGVTVREGTLDELLALNDMTFARQNRSAPYSRAFVQKLDAAAAARNAHDCLVAEDAQGKLHAGAYIVRSGNTAYYLLGGGNPELRSSGATSLVLWEAICRQPEAVAFFDFEGSMIEPIERFFRALGAVQTPYFRVSHTPSRFLRFAMAARALLTS